MEGAMDISEMIEISLGETGRDHVEVGDVEPARLAAEGAGGLSAIVAQLVHNATESLIGPRDKIRIQGIVESDGYSVLIIDPWAGMSDGFLEGINAILADPGQSEEPGASGAQMVAGLAARHGVRVTLEHGDPGVVARVSIPMHLLEQPHATLAEISQAEGPDSTQPDLALLDTETFLESIFGRLRDGDRAPAPVAVVPTVRDRVEKIVLTVPEPIPSLPVHRRDTLRTRVPGRNYSDGDPDSPHVRPGEAAVEIRLALIEYNRGRQAATRGDEDTV
jgi:hypothetical protein